MQILLLGSRNISGLTSLIGENCVLLAASEPDLIGRVLEANASLDQTYVLAARYIMEPSLSTLTAFVVLPHLVG
jgi:hypothetical protein